ncbi:hypothetical protein BsWGS_15630 [Bradybaena similaris]
MNDSSDGITNMVVRNETSLNVNRCYSEFGPIEIWIAAVAVVIVVTACLVWVISRHVNDTKQQEQNGYQFGQTIFVANFPMGVIVVSGTATRLCNEMQSIECSELTDYSLVEEECRTPLM